MELQAFWDKCINEHPNCNLTVNVTLRLASYCLREIIRLPNNNAGSLSQPHATSVVHCFSQISQFKTK